MTTVNRTKEQVADLFNSLFPKPVIKTTQSGSAVTVQQGNSAPIVFKRGAAVVVRSSVSVSR